MSFKDILDRYAGFDFSAFFSGMGEEDAAKVLSKARPKELDFLTLLCDRSAHNLESMAQLAHDLTIRHFGRVIHLYAPLYLGNHCDNECLYCGFRRTNPIVRKKLTLEEVEAEAIAVSRTGIRHILLLTGESRLHTPVHYLRDCVGLLKSFFTSMSIEVYPLESDEYRCLIDAGVDGLTIYQETYQETLYGRLHLKGPKRDFFYRLEAPARAAAEKIHSLSIGALLGLNDFRVEAFFLGLHAAYLQSNYPDVELAVSLPRLQPAAGDFFPEHKVTDEDLVRIMMALRIFLPQVGINISTRESGALRENLIGLGVTRMSAGSKTEVGGYVLKEKTAKQFNVADQSDVSEVVAMIRKKAHQPVFVDWRSDFC